MLTKEQISGWEEPAQYYDPYDDAPVVDDAYKQDFSVHYEDGEVTGNFTASFNEGYPTHKPKSLEQMAKDCHESSYNNGWWYDPDTGEELPTEGFLGAHVIGCKIGLIGSEVSEIMEGHRKQKMDDKLPLYQAADVEIVDTIIRLFDLAGKRKTPLTEIYNAKLSFNDDRLDHKLEARKNGGKLY